MSRRRRKPPKPDKPLAKRTQKERYDADRILHGRVGRPPTYNPEEHPASIIAHFREALESVQEIERKDTKHRIQYVQRPITPPTIAGWAAKVGIARETVWAWSKKHTEFDEALGICKAIQEHVFLDMGVKGAYNAGVLALMMKNLQGWQDRVEQTHKGSVVLQFDAQDRDA